MRIVHTLPCDIVHEGFFLFRRVEEALTGRLAHLGLMKDGTSGACAINGRWHLDHRLRKDSNIGKHDGPPGVGHPSVMLN